MSERWLFGARAIRDYIAGDSPNPSLRAVTEWIQKGLIPTGRVGRVVTANTREIDETLSSKRRA